MCCCKRNYRVLGKREGASSVGRLVCLLSDDTSGATQRGVMWHLALWHRVFVVNVGVQASTLPW